MTLQIRVPVVAVHGEGDRASLVKARFEANKLEVGRLSRDGKNVPQELFNPMPEVDGPQVVLVTRDGQGHQVDWPITTWEQVEELKALVGFDMTPHPGAPNEPRRHWGKQGADGRTTFDGVFVTITLSAGAP